jgi:transcriptional regulator with XRE-family HTH domain
MTLKSVFIHNLKVFREKEGLSQMKLAEYCNTSPGYIGEIEIGRKFPSTEMIEKIAYVLRVEPYLFFKNPKGGGFLSENEKTPQRIPNKIKTEMKAQISKHIKAKVTLTMNEILNEINEIISRH